MTRVALDYRPALYSTGGIGRAVRELARALAPLREIELHLFGHGLKRAHALPEHGRLHRTRIPGRALGALSAIGLDATRLAGNADLFHWTDYVFPPVRRSARVVQTVHDVAFLADSRFHGREQSRVLGARFKTAIARANAVVCPSRTTATELERHLGPVRHLHVIPFGADHVVPSAAGADRGRTHAAELLGLDAPYLVALATLEPRKNHASLLAALRSLHDRGRTLPLVCIGAHGWLTDSVVDRLANDPGFPCAWTGAIPDRDAFALLAGARALVYPSSLEGFGFPPMEALGLGVPVVAGDCGALREHLGDAAEFADGSDPADLARAILAVWDDRGRRERIVNAWRTRAVRYRWAQCAAQHVALYRELALREVTA